MKYDHARACGYVTFLRPIGLKRKRLEQLLNCTHSHSHKSLSHSHKSLSQFAHTDHMRGADICTDVESSSCGNTPSRARQKHFFFHGRTSQQHQYLCISLWFEKILFEPVSFRIYVVSQIRHPTSYVLIYIYIHTSVCTKLRSREIFNNFILYTYIYIQ